MGYFDTLLLASAVIVSGFIVGRLIHNFVDFVVDYTKRQDRENRDE
jgi:hypothetical protein